MSLFSSLRDLFRRPAPFDDWRQHHCCETFTPRNPEPSPTKHQLNVQTLAIHRLIQTGWIDALSIQKLGTTSAHKVLTRMRRLGVLYEANDPKGYVEVSNHSGHGRYRRHRWTRKFPPGWTSPFSGERRARKRGGR
ncbi:MAG: hypothetical protein R3D70_05950 [Rhizobiaceae bacterium]